MQYAETSAKEAQDVEEPFKLISRRRSSASSTSPGRGCLGRSTETCELRRVSRHSGAGWKPVCVIINRITLTRPVA